MLRKVKPEGRKTEDEDAKNEASLFEEEVKWYTHQKKAKQTKGKDFDKRMKSCDNVEMFDKLLDNVQEKDNKGIKHMPVRMFYRNTFNNLINTAIFELKKKQGKDQNNADLFTKEGSIKFVATYLMDNLPDGERRALDSVSDSD
jgi:glutamyl-tRNA reductase